MSYSSSQFQKLLSSKYTYIVIILMVSAGVYLNTLSNEFVYDDMEQVLENPWIKNIRYIPAIFFSDVWAFQGEVVSNYYRPVMHMIYMVDYYLFGLSPWGFHLTSIALHAGVSILVFLIALELISGPTTGTALFAALLFAVHPIHTEVVAWVAGVPDLSFSFFFLLSFYLYSISDSRRKMNYFSIVFFFLATLCKETAITLPIILFIYDYSFNKYRASYNHSFYPLLKRYLPYLIVVAAYLVLRSYAIGGFAPLRRHVQLTSYEYFINIFPLFAQYLEKVILPINLNAFYAFHPISSIFEWKGIAGAGITSAFMVFVYLSKRINKFTFFCLLWIVVPLLPVLYIPALGENTFADRYLYLPSVGFVILVSMAIGQIFKQSVPERYRGFVSSPIFIIILVLYSSGTIKRNLVWKNSFNLWLDTVQKSPDAALPQFNMGYAYYKLGIADKAMEHYNIALSLRPIYPDVYNNIGIIYYDKGMVDKAIYHYQEAVRQGANFPDVYNNMGNAYRTKAMFDEAIKYYGMALSLNPKYYKSHYNLGLTYYDKGMVDEAIEHYQAAVGQGADLPDLYNNLGNAFQVKGMVDEAIRHYQTSLRLSPNYSKSHYNLAIAYYDKGMVDKAIEHYQTAVRQGMDFPDIYVSLGDAFQVKGMVDEAIRYYQNALGRNPDHPWAHYSLAVVYYGQGLIDEAKEHYQKAIKLDPNLSKLKGGLREVLGNGE